MKVTMSALVAAAVLCGAAGVVRAQSLGDLARKEEARQKNIKTPAKTYTNKDLGSTPETSPAPAATPAPAAAATPAPAPAPAADKAKDAGPAKDQKYWADRKKALDDKLDRDKVLADAMQSRINGLTADYAARDDPAQRAQLERDRQRAVAELGSLQKAIKDDQQALTDLDEEARKAGVPPGWLR